MRRDVVRLVTLDFVLRIVLARVVGMSFVVEIPCVYLDDCSADMPGFRIPRHVITDFEMLSHREPLLAVSVRSPVEAVPEVGVVLIFDRLHFLTPMLPDPPFAMNYSFATLLRSKYIGFRPRTASLRRIGEISPQGVRESQTALLQRPKSHKPNRIAAAQASFGLEHVVDDGCPLHRDASVARTAWS
jgi:hypothetical protein